MRSYDEATDEKTPATVTVRFRVQLVSSKLSAQSAYLSVPSPLRGHSQIRSECTFPGSFVRRG